MSRDVYWMYIDILRYGFIMTNVKSSVKGWYKYKGWDESDGYAFMYTLCGREDSMFLARRPKGL